MVLVVYPVYFRTEEPTWSLLHLHSPQPEGDVLNFIYLFNHNHGLVNQSTQLLYTPLIKKQTNMSVYVLCAGFVAQFALQGTIFAVPLLLCPGERRRHV